MSTTVVRYQVKPERVSENERLMRAVYEELSALAPEGLRYATFRLDDGVSFVHVATTEGESPSPLAGLTAFRAFLDGVRERCDVPPHSSKAEVVGAYPRLVPEAAPTGSAESAAA